MINNKSELSPVRWAFLIKQSSLKIDRIHATVICQHLHFFVPESNCQTLVYETRVLSYQFEPREIWGGNITHPLVVAFFFTELLFEHGPCSWVVFDRPLKKHDTPLMFFNTNSVVCCVDCSCVPLSSM